MAKYFGITTGAAEREAERIVDSVRQAFLHVNNLQVIDFLNSSGKGIQITDLYNRAADILFFTFRSTVNANKIDPRFPSTTLSLDFSLRLPQSDGPIALAPATNLNSALSTPPRTPIQTSASGPSVISALTNATDVVLRTMDEAQLRQFIINARKSTNPHLLFPHQALIFCPLLLHVLLRQRWIALEYPLPQGGYQLIWDQ